MYFHYFSLKLIILWLPPFFIFFCFVLIRWVDLPCIWITCYYSYSKKMRYWDTHHLIRGSLRNQNEKVKAADQGIGTVLISTPAQPIQINLLEEVERDRSASPTSTNCSWAAGWHGAAEGSRMVLKLGRAQQPGTTTGCENQCPGRLRGTPAMGTRPAEGWQPPALARAGLNRNHNPQSRLHHHCALNTSVDNHTQGTNLLLLAQLCTPATERAQGLTEGGLTLCHWTSPGEKPRKLHRAVWNIRGQQDMFVLWSHPGWGDRRWKLAN